MTQTQETKKGHGGAKPLGIETITIRIDRRLEPLMNTVKSEFKSGRLTISDIEQLNSQAGKPGGDDKKSGHDEKKLLKKIADLEHDCEELHHLTILEYRSFREEKRTLNQKIEALESKLEASSLLLNEMYRNDTKNGIDGKLKKRLIQFCHPDKYTDSKMKAIASELTSELNILRSLD